VEDQQPAAGDLTESDDTTERDESDTAATQAATESADVAPGEVDGDAAEQPDDEAEAGATPAKDRRIRKKWLTGTRLAIAMAVAAVLFVGSAAFAGAAVQPYLTDRAAAATKLKVARTAANAITALWTYTPENMDKLADRASVYLSGDFEAQYRKFVDAIVAPNKQAKVTNTTEVIGAAVESLDDPNAVVIVYTNTTSTSPLTKNIPSLKYLSYRLFMKRTNGRWLVNRMTTITSLDLTPHL
jgi:Mce-associated membrane protein